MPIDNANFDFNFKHSGAYLEKLGPAGRAQLDFIQKTQEMEQTTYEADYKQHRDQRIATREEQITAEYHLLLNMPRPKNVPPPKLRTADEIKEQAQTETDEAYTTGHDEMMARHKNNVEDYVRKTLGLPTREQARADFRDREKAAFFERRQQQREQVRDRER